MEIIEPELSTQWLRQGCAISGGLPIIGGRQVEVVRVAPAAGAGFSRGRLVRRADRSQNHRAPYRIAWEARLGALTKIKAGCRKIRQAFLSSGMAAGRPVASRLPAPGLDHEVARYTAMTKPRNKVVQVKRFGGPEGLEVVDAPLPTAGRGAVSYTHLTLPTTPYV